MFGVFEILPHSLARVQQCLHYRQHFLKHRKKWFEPDTEATYVLWWVKEGHIPSIDEAKSRLMMLREKGDSADAFTFAKLFPAPHE